MARTVVPTRRLVESPAVRANRCAGGGDGAVVILSHALHWTAVVPAAPAAATFPSDFCLRAAPARLFRTSYETGERVDLKFTSLPCDNELFQVFSDFRIELPAHGYYVAPIDKGAIYVRPEDVDDESLAKKPAQGGL
ncbi:hypothetical protein [Burkholderia stabilis]|uniref:hypothetical protein n=1 Tax=Burkholderia stabilis TaxID=95485 RepID=UPI00080B84E8|nr:hypothetical protein [Burkholderia stabilis]